MSDQPAAVARVEADAKAKGLVIEIVKTEKTARTADEAAEAVGAAVGQIVKSLVFRGVDSGKAFLLLVSGANRVEQTKTMELVGEGLERPDAAFVREATGFAIGGVSPLGATGDLVTVMDEDLLQYETVWAAAGTPFHVFAVSPSALQEATGASVGAVH